jgi:AcrR family transcriptional regulator
MNSRSKTPGPARRARRTDARRLEILRAAARTFRARGYSGSGMRDIAAEADLSPANLYHYFRGKHEILFFCQDRWLERMSAEVDAAKRAAGPAPARLRRVLREHVRCLLDELVGADAHLEVEVLPPRLRSRLVTRRDKYEQGIRSLIRSGIARREFAACDAEVVTRAILGAANWTARWFHPEGRLGADEVAESVSDFLVRGLEPARSLPSPSSTRS